MSKSRFRKISCLPYRIFRRCRFYDLRFVTLAALILFSAFYSVYRSLNEDSPAEKQLADTRFFAEFFSSPFQMLYSMKISLILLDVNVLPLLNDTNFTTTSSTSNLISMGIFENDSSKIENLTKAQFGFDWRMIEFRGIDYRKIDKKRARWVPKLITHYFFVFKDSLTVHLAVVFRRQNFFWISEIDESMYPKSPNITFAIPFPMAVDAFDCEYLNFDQPFLVNLCVPKDLGYYLWQLPRAKFFECHYDDVVYPFKAKYDLAEIDTYLQQEALQEIMRISKESRISTTIFCGTLLGWYRQCDFIVHSIDVDVAVINYEYKQELFDRLFRSEKLTVYQRFGTLDSGLEFRTSTKYRLFVGRAYLDLFFLYEKKVDEAFLYMYSNGDRWRQTFPSRKGVCSAELYGVLVYLPCNYEEFILAEYGADGWFAPNELPDHVNMILEKTFDKNDLPYIEYYYQYYGCRKPNLLWGCDEVPTTVFNSTFYQNEAKMEKQKQEAKKLLSSFT